MTKLGMSIDYSSLRRTKFYDNNDKFIGKPIDFTIDESHNLSKIVLSGSFIEEMKKKYKLINQKKNYLFY